MKRGAASEAKPWPLPTPLGWVLLSTALSVAVLRPAGALCDLLVGALFALCLIGFGFARRAGLELVDVRRRLPRSATKGEAVQVVHELRQPGPHPLRRILVREWPSAEDPTRDCASYFPEVLGELKSEARARLFLPRRGKTLLRGVTLTTSDPFGLFVARREVELPGEVLVRPRPRKVEGRWGLRRARGRGVGGGDPSEWSAVREYRPGDPLRSINWRLTARRGYPVVRVSPGEPQPLSLLVLDRRAGARPGDFERAVSLAAGVGLHLLRGGAELRLLAPGREGLELTRLRGGVGATRLLEALALVRPDPRGVAALDPSEPLAAAVLVSAQGLAPGAARPFGLVLSVPELLPGAVQAERVSPPQRRQREPKAQPAEAVGA